jgi:O-antigen/teichoic acid export membrane protein
MTEPKLLKNSLSLLVNRLTQGIATFVLTAVIARELGADKLGQYILAISYYYIFVTFVGQGLKTLFTRELSKEAEKTSVYLVSGTLLQLILSIIGYVFLVATVFALPYNSDTSTVCYIMGLAVIPFALSNITEAIFQAQENMHFIAITTVPIYILRTAVMIWIINLNYSVNHIAAIMVFSEIFILLIQWIFLVRKIKPVWQIDKDFMLKSLYSVRTFFAIDASGIVAGKMDVLLISLLGSEFLVGLYGMIGQLLQPFSVISNSISLAAFPAMSKAVALGKDRQKQETENVLEILLSMSLPFGIGILFFAKNLLVFVYNDPKFLEANIPLQINAFALILSPFIRSFGYLLVANGLEKFNLLEVVITTVSGGLSGIVLISQYKLIGAAMMTIIMSTSAVSLLTYAVFSKLFLVNLWRLMRRPIIISILMIILFSLLKRSNLNFSLTLSISIIGYMISVILLYMNNLRYFKPVWQKKLKK